MARAELLHIDRIFSRTARCELRVAIVFALFLFMFGNANAAIVYTTEIPASMKDKRPRPETNITIYNPADGSEKVITKKTSNKLEYSLNSHPAVSRDGRRIAYSSFRIYFDENLKKWKDWNGQVCTMAYGAPLTEETYYLGYSYFPSREYYASMLSHNWNVFVYDTTTDKEKQVSFFKWDEGDPHFIGNSSTLLYSLQAQKSIFVLKTAGDKRGFKQIILQDNEVLKPEISRDGRNIAFQSFIDGNWEIYTVRLAEDYKDRIKTRLTHTSLISEVYPHWSPDGKSIVFAANSAGGHGAFNLFTMDVATKQIRQLTKGANVNGEAAWSPDGQYIAYTDTTSSHGAEIWLMRYDGTGKKMLTDKNGSNRLPAWSPDGKEIACISSSNGIPGLYIMNADGSGKRRVSQLRASWDQPVWY